MPKWQHKPHAGIRAENADSRTHALPGAPQLQVARPMKYLCGFLLIALAWFAFVAQFSTDEEILGALAALLGLAVSSLAWRRMQLHCSPTLREIAAAWRLPWCLIADTVVVTLILARDLLGKRAGSFFRATEFRASSGAKGVSQRILAVSYNTIAPNFIVIGVEDGKMVFHQLKRTGIPKLVADLESAQ
jgi:multisubunit Na+/H+ antiporter MnhE subunit